MDEQLNVELILCNYAIAAHLINRKRRLACVSVLSGRMSSVLMYFKLMLVPRQGVTNDKLSMLSPYIHIFMEFIHVDDISFMRCTDPTY